jgi:ribosomal protein L16/L10AE
MFEVSGLPEQAAYEALNLARHKFSIKTRVIARLDLAAGEQA